MEVMETRFPEPFENQIPKNSRRKNLPKQNKRRKKLPDLDKYLIFCFISIVVFTITIIVIFALTQQEPSTLVTCFFAAFGGEVLCCALIKKLKLDKQAKIQAGLEVSDDAEGNDSSCQ